MFSKKAYGFNRGMNRIVKLSLTWKTISNA